MSGSVSTTNIVIISNVWTKIGLTGASAAGLGTHQSSFFVMAVTRTEPSARTARFSRK